MKRRPFISGISLSRLLFISLLSCFVLFIGCAKDDDEEKRLEQAQKIMEEYQEKLDERMLEEAEKRGIGKEVLEMIEARKERERERIEKEEKEIRKILGEPGKPVEDKYLEELFAPEFPYESINIVEKADGSRYIIVDAEKKIRLKQKTQYVFETLLDRGVSVSRSISSHSGTVIDFMITIVRKIETPGVIEYSENRIYTPEEYKYRIENGLREALRFKGDKIMVEINPAFGHEFRRKVIYPEKDAEGPEPQDLKDMPENITRYPNSRKTGLRIDIGGSPVTIKYITEDPLDKVIEFFVSKKKEYYDNNPHMKTDSLYRQGEEEYYLSGDRQFWIIFGIKDIGEGVPGLAIIDLKRDKSVDISIKQSSNANLKDYVSIEITGGRLKSDETNN
jgi:hypothetical protein